jgi:hypothetical protein
MERTYRESGKKHTFKKYTKMGGEMKSAVE